MDTISVIKCDETWMRVDAEASILYELKDYFTFDVPGAKFMPKFKMKIWDGKLSMLNIPACTMYVGLLSKLKEFCKDREYELVIDDALQPSNVVTPKDIFEFVRDLNIHSDGKPLATRDYQLTAIYHAIHDGRLTLLSPTASGKSYILYCVMRWILKNPANRILLIVPDLGLVKQMFSDFIDYSSHNGFDVTEITQTISEGATKVITSNITISTWQSIQYQNSGWMNQFDAIFCDEVHTAQAKSIKTIMEKATRVSFRLGATGTLSGSKTHEWVIQGLFGRVVKVITTAELIEHGHIANIKINCVVLEYQDKEVRKLIRDLDYQGEMDYICRYEPRNDMIVKMALCSKGNTLILFNYVDKHGQILYDKIIEKLGTTDRKVFFIHGGVASEDRDAMRAIVEKENDAIIVASYGTLSRGTNIKRLHNIIAASPTKSLIRLLQSIGRGLRKGVGKDVVNWYDIVDDFSGGNKNKNYVFLHFIERLKIYTDQKFQYKIVKMKM